MLDRKRLIPLLALCAIALSACGGTEQDEVQSGGPVGAPPAPAPAPVPAPGPAPAPAPAPTPAPAPAPATASETLQWSSSADSRVQGYRVYYGSQSRAYVQSKGAGLGTSTTSYVVGGLVAGRTYYFAVTSYDALGNESDYSGEVSKVVD